MTRPQYVTIVVHRDGDVASRRLQLPLWAARTLSGAAMVLAGLIIFGLVLYAPIVRSAARVPGLNRDLMRLRAENAKVRELASTLDEIEASYSQLRSMLGAKVASESTTRSEPTTSVASQAAHLAIAYPIYVTAPGTNGIAAVSSPPVRWPLDDAGFITRGTVIAGTGGEEHAGLDVAVPFGTPIRAAGGGMVVESIDHPEYGLFVRIQHPGGYESMYGHASRLLVAAGDSVRVGQVIAMSGSTGRSTAPHLHFEIRLDGRSLDPRNLLTQEP